MLPLNDKHKIVIVSYTFPPMHGVGGRRWTKLSNALCELGHEIYVFCARPNPGETSYWEVNKSIKINRLSRNYPQIINRIPKNIIEKISYRMARWIMSLCTKGNYYDRGIFWRKHINHIADYMVNHSIKTLVVSGGPFSLLYYSTQLKLKYPEMRVLIDIRDEWGAAEFYGFGLLSNKRKKVELDRLKFTLRHADRVLVPYTYLANKYKEFGGDGVNYITVLPHGVDEIFIQEKRIKKAGDTFRMVNFGSIHSGQECYMLDLSESLLESDICIDFYTHEKKYASIFQVKNLVPDKINYHEPVAEEKVAKILSDYNAALLFIPHHFKDSISTKFMEIIATRTPIVAIGTVGEASEFIVKNNLGLFIPYAEIKARLTALKDEMNNLNYNDDFDISAYRFIYQAKNLIEIIENT